MDYCVQGPGQSEGSKVNECLSGLYLLNRRTFVTKLGIVMWRHEPECHTEGKKIFAIFKVKVTARAHMVKI